MIMSKNKGLAWRLSCYEAFIADPDGTATLGLDIKAVYLAHTVRVIYADAMATATSGVLSKYSVLTLSSLVTIRR